VAVEGDVGDRLHDAGEEAVAQPGKPRPVGRDVGARPFDRRPEADDAGKVLGAGAPAPLLPAAVDEVCDFCSVPDVEGADALGAVELVAREGEEVDVVLIDVEFEVADRLDGVGVEGDAVLAGDGADLADRLDGPDLVVGGHHRDQNGAVGDRIPDGRRIDPPLPVDRQVGDREALLFQEGAGVEDGVVLDRRRDDVVAPVAVRMGDPLDRPVVRLGPAGGEEDLFGACADRRGNL